MGTLRNNLTQVKNKAKIMPALSLSHIILYVLAKTIRKEVIHQYKNFKRKTELLIFAGDIKNIENPKESITNYKNE